MSKKNTFIPTEFAKGLDNSISTASNEKSAKRLVKKWLGEMKNRDLCVSEEALKHNFICWLHGWSSGFRDDEFNVLVETPKDRDALRFIVIPLRDNPDAKSYICDIM